IGDALEVLVDGDAALFPDDIGCLQVEVVDLWDPAGAVDCQVRLESTRLLPRGGMDEHAISSLLDAFDVRVQVHLDAKLAGGLDKALDQVRIEPLQRAGAAVDDLDLGAGASRNMRELEGDVAPSHEDDLAWQPVEL